MECNWYKLQFSILISKEFYENCCYSVQFRTSAVVTHNVMYNIRPCAIITKNSNTILTLIIFYRVLSVSR